MKKLFVSLLFLSACTTVNLNKSISINLDQAGVGKPGDNQETAMCLAAMPYVMVPININYFTSSEQSLKDFLNPDTKIDGTPGF